MQGVMEIRWLIAHIYQGKRRADTNSEINHHKFHEGAGRNYHHDYGTGGFNLQTVISTPPNEPKENRRLNDGPTPPADRAILGPYGGACSLVCPQSEPRPHQRRNQKKLAAAYETNR
jgi:hypothetical protein